jgi:hypothetical protein
MARPVKADGWKRVLAQRPEEDTTDAAFWSGVLSDRPDVLHRLLADVHRSAYGASRPPTLEDLWDLVGEPAFSHEPFGTAFHEVLGTRSISQVAVRAGMHRGTLLRYVNAERPIVSTQDPEGSMRRLEVVARALVVHPSYFSEWRRLWIMMLIDGAFSGRPELSVSVYRRFSAVVTRNGRSEAS